MDADDLLSIFRIVADHELDKDGPDIFETGWRPSYVNRARALSMTAKAQQLREQRAAVRSPQNDELDAQGRSIIESIRLAQRPSQRP